MKIEVSTPNYYGTQPEAELHALFYETRVQSKIIGPGAGACHNQAEVHAAAARMWGDPQYSARLSKDFASCARFADYCTAVYLGKRSKASAIRSEKLYEHIETQLEACAHEQSTDTVDALAESFWSKYSLVRETQSSFGDFRAYCRGVARQARNRR